MTVCTEGEGIATLRATARMRGERMYEIGTYSTQSRDLVWNRYGLTIGPIDGFDCFVPRLCWRAADRALVMARTIDIARSVMRNNDLDPA